MVDIRTMVRSNPRRAGAVQRYHTWPTIQTQTVAEASWNVARILVMIWPGAPAAAITHALLNDCGELRSGDLPFPIKRDNPVLKSEISRIEAESLEEQGIADLATVSGMSLALPETWKWWEHRVKICDMLEMWEFGLDEMALGNRYAEPIVQGTIEDVERLMNLYEMDYESDQQPIRRYIGWRRERTPQ